MKNRMSFEARPVRSAGEIPAGAAAVRRHPALRPAAWPAAPASGGTVRAIAYHAGGRALPPARAPAAGAAAAGRRHCEGLEDRTLWSVSLDTQGWTVVTPSPDTRFVYVSAAGNDANAGLSPDAPVATFAKARSLARNGMPDQILLRRGDTFTQTLSAWDLSGRSAQEPFVIGAYTDPAAPSSQRPRVASGISSGFSGANKPTVPVRDVYILGVAFEASARNYRQPGANFTTAVKPDATGGTYGVNVLGTFADLLVEDCSFQYYRTNLAVQAGNGTVSDVKIRRNQVLDAYVPNVDAYGITLGPSSGGTSEGIYAEGVKGLTIDGNVLDHNGWVENNALGAVASIYNHNLYINAGNSDVVVTNNLIAEGASHGLQMRPGGVVTNNVFVRNAIHMSFGYVNGAGKPGGVSGEVSNNVFLEDRDINGATRGYGLELANLKAAADGGGTLVKNNVFAADSQRSFATIRLDVPKADNPTAQVGINDLTLDGNLIYAWYRGIYINGGYTVGGTGFTGINNLVVRNNDIQRQYAGAVVDHGPTVNLAGETWTNNRYDSVVADGTSNWFRVAGTGTTAAAWQANSEPTAAMARGLFPDPTRGVGAYNGTQGGPATTEAFLAEARRQSRAFWRPAFTADPVIDYVRTGFAGGRIDLAGPTASAAAPNLTIGGAATQTVTVTYADENPLDLSSIGDGDVTVTGPNGYAAAATFVSMTGPGEGNKRVVTYTVPAPGGAWSAAADGLYSVVLQPGQVLDAGGRGASAGAVGSFAVVIDPSVPSAAAVAASVSVDSAPAAVTVTYAGATSPLLPTSVSPVAAGFETPNVGAGLFQYNPADGGWAFAGTAGVSGNNSGFTYANPSAPQGEQVAFLQMTGTVSQTVADWLPGTYTVAFQAAQRALYWPGQDFQVQVDGQVVGTFTPAGTDYATYTTAPFTVSAGAHTIAFVGLNSAGGDNTAFLDDVRVTGTTVGGPQTIAAATLDAGDIQVVAPTGTVVATAAAAVVDSTADGAQRVVTYTVPAPAGGWAAGGSLSVVAVAGQVQTTGGVAVPAGKIGTLKVAVNAPTASVQAGDVTSGSTGAQAFTVTYADNAPGLRPSLDSGDLRVTGPKGFNAPATLVGTNDGLGTAASPLVATYSVAAPAGGWSAAGNGTYFVVAQPGQVTDADGNALPAGAIGSFRVAIDVTAPVMWSDTPNVTSPTPFGGTPAAKSVGISFFDVSGVDAASLDNADVRVVGPNGYDQPTVKTFAAGSGTATYATYALAPPTRGWKPVNNGTYSVVVQPNQVFDKAGNALAAAKVVTTFDVAIDTNPPVATLGPASPNPRNSAVSSLPIKFSKAVIGLDPADLSLARDGVPVSLAGATVSTTDNVTWTLGNLSGLTAAAGRYTLTLTAANSGIIDAADILMVADASTTWLVDVVAPTLAAATAGGPVTEPGTGGVPITVTYADNTAIAAGSVGTGDVWVTGPNGYAAAATLVSATASGTGLTAVYAAPAPNGRWTSAYNGSYAVALQPNQVADTAGNPVPAGTLGGFTVGLETTPPTVTAAAVTPSPRTTPLDATTFTFSEPVSGFDLPDLSLTRDGAAVPLDGATLTTADNVTFTVGGLTAATAVKGQYVLTVAAAGSGVVDAAGNPLAAGAAATFTVDPALPAVLGITVGDGTAQRSDVRAVTLRFNEPVALSARSLTLVRSDGGGTAAGRGASVDATAALATPSTPDGGLTWVYTFAAGDFTEEAGSLKDGLYTLTLSASGVASEDGPMAADASLTFHRLFGDRDGNGTVNNVDFLRFRRAVGSTAGTPAYDRAFDFDANGIINNADFLRFRTRFGTSISPA